MPRMLTAAILGAALAVSTTLAHAEKPTAERVYSDPDLNGPTARSVQSAQATVSAPPAAVPAGSQAATPAEAPAD